MQLGKDIRQFNQSYFIVIASTIAWEWHATHSLAKTLEYCGTYHFGQWAHVFAEQKHYFSDKSDLQQTASAEEFGHPYAFIGIPGTGAGTGWESLMHNTGQYLPRGVKPQHAVIRGVAYYDYMLRTYRLQDVEATKAEFYMKGTPPSWESFHNPVPEYKNAPSEVSPIPSMQPAFTPYIGALSSSITKIIEANETVPPHNFAFALVTAAKVRKVDPRPRSLWVTELERIWEGASARYWDHNGSLFHPGLLLFHRSCNDFVYHGFNFASPEACGEDFSDCCDRIDVPSLLATQCGIGVAPTMCKESIISLMENYTELLTEKWPYNFTVIRWES